MNSATETKQAAVLGSEFIQLFLSAPEYADHRQLAISLFLVATLLGMLMWA